MCETALLAALMWMPWASQHLMDLEPAERNRRVAIVLCQVQYSCQAHQPDPDMCVLMTSGRKPSSNNTPAWKNPIGPDPLVDEIPIWHEQTKCTEE